MADRRRMQAGDWFNGAALVAVGFFLGLSLDGMVDLAGTAFWPLIIAIPVLFGSVFLIANVFDRLIERIFPNGIKPAKGPQRKERRPLALVLSLPSGLVLGVDRQTVGDAGAASVTGPDRAHGICAAARWIALWKARIWRLSPHPQDSVDKRAVADAKCL